MKNASRFQRRYEHLTVAEQIAWWEHVSRLVPYEGLPDDSYTERPRCGVCHGSGIGRVFDSRCTACSGSGVLPSQQDRDDAEVAFAAAEDRADAEREERE